MNDGHQCIYRDKYCTVINSCPSVGINLRGAIPTDRTVYIFISTWYEDVERSIVLMLKQTRLLFIIRKIWELCDRENAVTIKFQYRTRISEVGSVINYWSGGENISGESVLSRIRGLIGKRPDELDLPSREGWDTSLEFLSILKSCIAKMGDPIPNDFLRM